jgi:hypothetical protein
MRQVIGCVVLLGAMGAGSGCGDDSRPRMEPTFTDGTRLVAQTFWSPGTVPLFVGIHDRDEGVACVFRPAVDGSLRCLPDDPAAAETPERWVAGTQMPGSPTGRRLQRYEVYSADGGRFPDRLSGELYDADMGEPCGALLFDSQDDETTGAYCMPRHARVGGFFADAGCSEPVATAAETGPEPLLALALDTHQLHALGEPVTGRTFMKVAATCQTFPLPGVRIFRLGAPLPNNAVPNLTVVSRGDVRLRLRTLQYEGEDLTNVAYRHYPSSPGVASAPYRDAKLQYPSLPCFPMLAVDGATYCLPADAYVDTRPDLLPFADSACSQRVIRARHDWAIFAVSDPAGPVAMEVRAADPARSDTGYVLGSAGCREDVKSAGYPVSADVAPLDSFVRLVATP